MRKLLLVFSLLLSVICFVGCASETTDKAEGQSEEVAAAVSVDDILNFDIPDGFESIGTMNNNDGSVVQHSWEKESGKESALWYVTLLTRDGKAVLDANNMPMGVDGSVDDYVAFFKEEGRNPDKVIDLKNIDAQAYVFETKNDDGGVESIETFVPYKNYIIGFDAFIGVHETLTSEDAEIVRSISKDDIAAFYKTLASVSADDDQ